MEPLRRYLEPLGPRHRQALEWFAGRARTIVPWPGEIDSIAGPTLLATKAKGIYKPAWTEYALSVRQSLAGPYPDHEPIHSPDGTWTYAYFQENQDVSAGRAEFTNQGLLSCWKDRVPVGVFRQVRGRPPLYEVLGLALVTSWTDGYFFLDGFSPAGWGRGPGPLAEVGWLAASQTAVAAEEGAFDPKTVLDARERVMAQIVRRRGQPQFRAELLTVYESRCVVSACDAEAALEACHIFPYRGAHTNHASNGLLLRADLHTLFDLGLIAVDPSKMQVVVARKLRGSQYEQYAGALLREPNDPKVRPDAGALLAHREWAGI